MNGIDIAIIVVVSALFVAALGYIIYRKLKGKGGCDCADCASCGACKNAEKKANENKGENACCCCHCDGEQKSE